jgi:hypothetical protein
LLNGEISRLKDANLSEDIKTKNLRKLADRMLEKGIHKIAHYTHMLYSKLNGFQTFYCFETLLVIKYFRITLETKP